MRFLRKLLPVLLFGGLFLAIIYLTSAPKSWFEASVTQILSFFLPLLLFLSFLIDLKLNNLVKSFTVALGVMVLLVLKSIDQLNLVTLALTIIATFLLSSSFKDLRLTTQERPSKLGRLRRLK